MSIPEDLNLEKELSQKMLDLLKKIIINEEIPCESMKNDFVDYVCMSEETFKDYVMFVDTFNRFTKSFKFFAKFHLWAKENHKKYKSLFELTTKKGMKEKNYWPENKNRGQANFDDYLLNNV